MSKSEGQTITKSARAFSPTTQKRREKALLEKRTRIMDAALSLFSKNGVSGTTVEQVSELANVSKSNLLYYFKSKEGLYLSVITHLLDVWLTPLQSFSAEQDPIETLSAYIKVKLETLKTLLDAKSAVIIEWIDAGKLKPVDPIHLIFSIWAITQHYADFNVQIKAVTDKDLSDPAFFESTLSNIQHIILGGLKPA